MFGLSHQKASATLRSPVLTQACRGYTLGSTQYHILTIANANSYIELYSPYPDLYDLHPRLNPEPYPNYELVSSAEVHTQVVAVEHVGALVGPKPVQYASAALVITMSHQVLRVRLLTLG